MGSTEPEGNGAEALPPPPPVPDNIVPIKADGGIIAEKKVVRLPMARRSLGTKGQKIPLLTNHFKVRVANVDGHFYHYCV